jgi:hypothetical protein
VNEEVVIRGLLARGEYQKYAAALKSLKGMEREHKQILAAVGRYWEEYPEVEQLTPDELVLFFNRLNPALKDKGMYDEILGRIRDVEITNPALLADELRCLVETQYAGEILKLALLKVEGQKSTVIPQIKEQITAYEEMVGTLEQDDGVMGKVSLGDLLAMQQGPYKWRMPFLQEQIGAPPPGTLGHVYAYPETGKTTWAVFEAVNFAYQMRKTGDKLLFLVNEEAVARTHLRAFCSFVGKPLIWLRDPENEEEAHSLYKRYEEDILPQLIFIDGVNHIRQVEAHIKQHKPAMVIIDQGVKVRSLTTETGPAVLAALYNWYRETAKTYKLVLITLGQADAAAQNRQRLTLANMDGSKIGIPGELDFAIGISKVDDEGKQWVRYFTITKNKLTGNLEHYRGYLDRHIGRFK